MYNKNDEQKNDSDNEQTSESDNEQTSESDNEQTSDKKINNLIQNNISWLELYRPKTLSEYYISKKQLDVVKTWIKDFRNKTEDIKPFLILYGTTGIGKTTLAHLIFNYYDYEIIECNASDTRTKKTIRDSIGQISKVSVCVDEKNKFKQTAIIMDEIDGLAGGESNSVQELIDIVTKDKDSKSSTYLCPVICTTNSIKDKKLAPLIKQGIVLNISKPSQNNCIKLIDKITNAENFSVPDYIKNEIIDNSYGDYRQIIMLLFQYYHSLKIKIINEKNNNEKNNNEENNNEENNNEEKNNEENNNEEKKNINKKNQLSNTTLTNYDDDIDHYKIIKQIANNCETPLDKINFFLTNNINFENIRHICSDDSNLYYMNFYINVIQIIYSLQNREGLKTKESMLIYYKLLFKIYESLKSADLLNNTIFLDKNWELLDYFDSIGIALPLKILNSKNINNNGKYLINNFQLIHHTQYNFMRQEQALIRKKLNIDYGKIRDIDLTNIYYNLKRFKHINKEKIDISNSRSKKKKTNSNNEDSKYQIDKIYLKIIDKIEELLA